MAATDCRCQNQQNSQGPCGAALPDSPDCAINYHFGMLLGVDDFRAEQGFHIGLHRRHQRALHGYGVVYGYPVDFSAKTLELRVGPGLATDRLGRDLYLDTGQCLGLPAWWEKHQNDEAYADLKNKADVSLDLEVLLCYRACLSRPVPAIADPCGSGSDIAYARICEAPRLSLARRQASSMQNKLPPYHLLRLLAGLDAPWADAEGTILPDDVWLAQSLAAIAASPAAQQAEKRLALWQAVAARAAALTSDPSVDPPWPPPPVPDDGSFEDTSTCLVIARLDNVHIVKDAQGYKASLGGIDIDQRMTLLPTGLLQSLAVSGLQALPTMQIGPVVVKDGAKLKGDTIELMFNMALYQPSVTSQAFSADEYVEGKGWQAFQLEAPSYDNEKCVNLPLGRKPETGANVRVCIHGTGAAPLLSADKTPSGFITAQRTGTDLSIIISKD